MSELNNKGSENGEIKDPNGIAVDAEGNIYVADTGNYRVQKLNNSFEFLGKWGSFGGSGDGHFNMPIGCVVYEHAGGKYIYVTGFRNCRVQKFTLSGEFITKWGSQGSVDGQFSMPYSIDTDSNGNVYVVDTYNNRVQKFDSGGNFLTKWGNGGNGNGEFNLTVGIAVNKEDQYVYVADAGNYRVQKFTSNGTYVLQWGSQGTGDGQFNAPGDIAIDSNGYVYVSDEGPANTPSRVQKFTGDGTFVASWDLDSNQSTGSPRLYGVAIDGEDNLFVVDTRVGKVSKFTSDGTLIAKFGSGGDDDGQFSAPNGIAVDSEGNVYVVDSDNHRVQKFSTTIPTVSSPTVTTGSANPVTSTSVVLNGTVNPNGSGATCYFKYGSTTSYGSVTQLKNTGSGWTATAVSGSITGLTPNTAYHYRLAATNGIGTAEGIDKTFTTSALTASAPTVTTEWGTAISESSAKLNGTVNPNGAATTYYFQYGTTTGYGSTTESSNAGSGVGNVSVNAELSGLVTNTTYHFRLTASNSVGTTYGEDQSFTTGKRAKAIIVAGGGPYAGNNIWTAVEMNSGYAFKALLYQGYTKDTIYYLSPNTSYDVDGDGFPDVDADATRANLENAIKSWSQGASDLFLYLIGHGGVGTFRIAVAETLSAEDLDGWLDDAQNSVFENAVILYDSCRSGSFLPLLLPPNGKQRVLTTSASSGQETLFSVRGTLSFSYLFWSHIFNGDSFYDSFSYATDSLSIAYPRRMTPQIDGNGNGVGNEKEDKILASEVEVGAGIKAGRDLPSIGSVSLPQTVYIGNPALIYAKDLIALEGVKRVWAVIVSPNYSSSPESTVTDLPTLDLSWSNGRYEGKYNDFKNVGTYNIAVFVEDNSDFLSLPAQTTVIATSTTITTTSTTTTSTTTTLPTLSACPECAVSPVVLTDVTFNSGTACECSDATSITIGAGVTAKSGANVIFKAPTVKIQSGFKAENGSTVSIKQQ